MNTQVMTALLNKIAENRMLKTAAARHEALTKAASRWKFPNLNPYIRTALTASPSPIPGVLPLGALSDVANLYGHALKRSLIGKPYSIRGTSAPVSPEFIRIHGIPPSIAAGRSSDMRMNKAMQEWLRMRNKMAPTAPAAGASGTNAYSGRADALLRDIAPVLKPSITRARGKY